MITINNTVPGVIKNIEVKGNTYQDPNNLSKIVSAGIDNGDGTYKMSILSSNGLEKTDINYKETRCDVTLPRPLRSTLDKSIKDRLYYDKKSKTWCIEQNVDDESNILGDGVSIIHQLPKNIDILLESYAERTDVSVESGEVSAIAKVTVSKSMASAVQSNTNEINILNGKIADIQGLKESQDFAYETDKGYLICKDTQNGVVKDLKLNGKSLVNIPLDYSKLNKDWYKYDNATKTLTNNSNQDSQMWVNVNPVINSLTVGETYTFICDIPKVGTRVQYSTRDSEPQGNIQTTSINTKSIRTFVAESSNFKIKVFDINNAESKSIDHIIIIKGDYTENPPGYFEGIASVGNGNEIEVSSIKSDGNLFDASTITKGKALNTNGTDTTIVNENAYISDFIRCFKGVKYNTNRNQYGTVWNLYDKDRKFVKQYTATKVLTADIDGFLKAHCVYTDKSPEEFMINIGDKDIDYKPFKQDKKPILFKDVDEQWKPVTELRGVNNVRDTIENGVLNVKYGVHVIGENSNIIKRASIGTLDRYDLVLPDKKYKSDNVLCDKFKFMISSLVPTESDNLTFTHNTENKLIFNSVNTPSIEDFKTKYKDTVVIYEISETKKYEVNPLEVESFENETMILFGSGVVAPYASWKIASHAANIIKNQGQRLTRLENDFYKYTVVQNRIMLDSRYAADSATFKIDTSIYNSNNATASNLSASICAAKETRQDVKYDFDLYKLIKRNILVGKDNYDREWMEECITFYWMDFKISDQMYSELNEIIENQYNPPVDMIPIEPPMEDVVEEIPQV
ncbi:hypothetical protein UT300012_32090 [Paraclostridium bifermentans]